MLNCKQDTSIDAETETHCLEDVLKFDQNGDLKFVYCNNFNGPILGHNKIKCDNMEEEAVYDEKLVKIYENRMKNSAAFKKAINKNKEKKSESKNRERLNDIEFIANAIVKNV